MVKNMNSKMTNSQLSTTEPKKKKKNKNELSKLLQQEQNHRNGDHMEGYQQGGGEGGEDWGKGTGNKKHKWQVQNRQGQFKNSIGNGEAKELMCTTHGHELRRGSVGGKVGTGQREIRGRKQTRQL